MAMLFFKKTWHFSKKILNKIEYKLYTHKTFSYFTALLKMTFPLTVKYFCIISYVNNVGEEIL